MSSTHSRRKMHLTNSGLVMIGICVAFISCDSLGKGTAPVVAAMAFAFFNIRSYKYGKVYGKTGQGLFRCSKSGGSRKSNCQAPSSSTSSSKAYVLYMYNLLGSACEYTAEFRMAILQDFFTDDYTDNKITTGKLISFPSLQPGEPSVKDIVFKSIKSGWPPIVRLRDDTHHLVTKIEIKTTKTQYTLVTGTKSGRTEKSVDNPNIASMFILQY